MTKHSAGIIPIIFKENHDIKILLGKERQGWSSFSGGSELNEDYIETAIREFNEETCYIYKFIDKKYVEDNVIDIVKSTTPSGKQFHLYLIDFTNENVEEITKEFETNRKKMNNIYEKEKYDIGWFDLERILKLKLRNCFYKDFKTIFRIIIKNLKK